MSQYFENTLHGFMCIKLQGSSTKGQTYIIYMRFCVNIYIDLSVVYVEEKIHEYQAADEWRKLQI